MTDATIPLRTADLDRGVQMRNRVVDDLIADGTIVSGPVEAVMRKVPREMFAPELPMEEIYHPSNGAVTKRDAHGNAVSSLSAPQVQAYMLEQAHIEPGMNVLEVGSGGMNAAYLLELVGPSGRVTTVDIDPFVTERAARLLEEAGYSRANVVLADAEGGVPEYAPYDRILITVGASDIPSAWVDQLADGGRLVVPLEMRGQSRTIAFDKADGHLVSYSARLFGFVPMQGAGAREATLFVMRGGEVTLRFDEKTDVDPRRLEHVFDNPRVEVWSGATIGRTEPWATAHMWLATTLPGFCRVVVDKSKTTGLISPPGSHTAAPAVVGSDCLAYVTTRGVAESSVVEFGVHAFGPHAGELAEHVAEQLRVWAREHRGGPGPTVYVHPAGTPDDALPSGRVVDKPHCRITISWPGTASAAAGQGALHDPDQ